MAERTSIWNVVNAVLGGMAAIVTAGTGLYLALRSDPAPIRRGKTCRLSKALRRSTASPTTARPGSASSCVRTTSRSGCDR